MATGIRAGRPATNQHIFLPDRGDRELYGVNGWTVSGATVPNVTTVTNPSGRSTNIVGDTEYGTIQIDLDFMSHLPDHRWLYDQIGKTINLRFTEEEVVLGTATGSAATVAISTAGVVTFAATSDAGHVQNQGAVGDCIQVGGKDYIIISIDNGTNPVDRTLAKNSNVRVHAGATTLAAAVTATAAYKIVQPETRSGRQSDQSAQNVSGTITAAPSQGDVATGEGQRVTGSFTFQPDSAAWGLIVKNQPTYS